VTRYVERVGSAAFEKFRKIITDTVGGKNGIYALYRNRKLYYVGLATDLRRRVNHHLRDRHKGKWNYFSLYLLRGDRHMKDVESLAMRIADPKGNRIWGKPKGAVDLGRILRRKMTEQVREEIMTIFPRDMGGDGLRGLALRRRKAARKAVKTRMAREAGERHVVSRKGVALKGLLARAALRAKYRGTAYSAWVLPSGRIRVKGHPGLFDSPSGAANSIRKKQTNGWVFWNYKDQSGHWAPLTALREQAIKQ